MRRHITTMAAALLVTSAAAFGASDTSAKAKNSFTDIIPADYYTTVRVHNDFGRVVFHVDSGTSAITVTSICTATGATAEDAVDLLDELYVTLTPSSGILEVTPGMSKNWEDKTGARSSAKLDVTFVVTVPANVDTVATGTCTAGRPNRIGAAGDAATSSMN